MSLWRWYHVSQAPGTISLSRCWPAPAARAGLCENQAIIVQTLHNNIKISGQAIYNAAPSPFWGQPSTYQFKWIWLSTCVSHSSHVVNVVSIRQVSHVGIIITDNVTQCSDDHRMTDHYPGTQDHSSPRRSKEAAPDHSTNCNSSVCILLLPWSEIM